MIKLTSNVLASASPRRKDLLNQIGIEFSIIPSNINEDFRLTLPPEAFTEHWAREKALNISKDHPSSIIIGADTVVVLDGQIIGKPKDENDSKEMLLKLSGKTHEVITGVSLIHIDSKIDITFNERTYVSINTLTKIGKGSLVSPGSILSGEYPPYSVLVGNPARVSKNRKNNINKK